MMLVYLRDNYFAAIDVWDSSRSAKGSFLRVVRYLRDQGIPLKEIHKAVSEMNDTGNNVAEFGVNHYFTVSTHYNVENL